MVDVSDHAAPKEVTNALALLDGTLRDNPNSESHPNSESQNSAAVRSTNKEQQDNNNRRNFAL